MDAYDAGRTFGESIGWILIFLYMLPTFIALVRKHPNVIIIGLLNFFLGWSVICWFVCLIWCFIGSKS